MISVDIIASVDNMKRIQCTVVRVGVICNCNRKINNLTFFNVIASNQLLCG